MNASVHHCRIHFNSFPGPLLLLIALMFALSSAACSHQSSDDNAPTPVLSGHPNTTYPMPPFKADAEMGWTLADGKRARLADYEGKVVVLDFYATWCVPCRQSIPHLIALQQRYGPGLQVIGLNVGGPDDRIQVPNFARELGIKYPLGFPDKAFTDLFLSDNQTIPQTFVFGGKSQGGKRFIGYDQATGAELEKTIVELLKNQN